MSDDAQPPVWSREEARATLRALRRGLRDARVREGRVAPRTHREFEVWRQGVHERFGIGNGGPDDDPPAIV